MTTSAIVIPRQPVSRTGSFTVVAAVMVLFQVTAAAPTPLYVVYQRRWGFTSTTLTLVFAVFVLVLLGSLLVFGRLSDHLGRRPVLLGAIVIEATAVVVFLLADRPAMLFAARAIQGVATGVALPTLSAALVDLSPRRAPVINGVVPIGGLAVGSLACGALVQYGPYPTHLVWAVLLVALAVASCAVLALRESPTRQVERVRLVPRLRVPRELRGAVYALVPMIVASWALGGFYLSLGPSVAAGVLGITDHFVGGLVPALLCGTGAASAFLLRRSPHTPVTRLGGTLLPVGTTLTLLGLFANSLPAGVVGVVVAGVGYGAAGQATFGRLATLAGPVEPVHRGELFAFGYTAAYLAFSLPAVAAGYATTVVGLRTTVVAYSIAVVAIGLAALSAGLSRIGTDGSAISS